jgi:hypothetical protein
MKESNAEPLKGIVEIDETYIGGKGETMGSPSITPRTKSASIGSFVVTCA